MRGIWERGWEAGRGFLDLPNTGMSGWGERDNSEGTITPVN